MTETQTLHESEMELYSKKFVRWMDPWRDVVLCARSVFLWEKPSYPWILAACITAIFVELAALNPTVMTLLSLTFLVWLVTDYWLPVISSAIWPASSWTANKQRDLDNTAAALAATWLHIVYLYRAVQVTKVNHPVKYFSVAISSLLLLSWFGSILNNLFITYLIVMAVVMAPGLIHTGLAQNLLENGRKGYGNAIQTIFGPKLD